MERRDNNVMARSTTILLCISVIMLFASPVFCADVIVPVAEEWYIDYPVTGKLWVYGIANLLTGTSVTESIYVQAGGTLNIYSGSVGQGWFVSISTVNEKVTVYGTNFGGDGDFSVPGQVSFPSGSGTLTGTYGDGSTINLFFAGSTVYLEELVTNEEVEIDIKPGSNPNSINLKSNGVVPVAVLTTSEFDAADVDPPTVEFAGASPLRWTLCDVDDDGDEDMLFHFKTQELNLDEDSTEADLTGLTNGGNDISGTDDVRIVPPKPKNKNKSKSNKKKK